MVKSSPLTLFKNLWEKIVSLMTQNHIDMLSENIGGVLDAEFSVVARSPNGTVRVWSTPGFSGIAEAVAILNCYIGVVEMNALAKAQALKAAELKAAHRQGTCNSTPTNVTTTGLSSIDCKNATNRDDTQPTSATQIGPSVDVADLCLPWPPLVSPKQTSKITEQPLPQSPLPGLPLSPLQPTSLATPWSLLLPLLPPLNSH